MELLKPTWKQNTIEVETLSHLTCEKNNLIVKYCNFRNIFENNSSSSVINSKCVSLKGGII